MVVVGLCAGWCHVCRDFRPAFERLAGEWPQARFVWLDIEDDSETVGEVEVENFPTIAVFVGGRAVHYGVSLPQEAVVRRTLRALATAAPLDDPPQALATLLDRLAP